MDRELFLEVSEEKERVRKRDESIVKSLAEIAATLRKMVTLMRKLDENDDAFWSTIDHDEGER